VARQALPAAQPATEPVASLQTFEDMLALIDRRRDIALKLDVERFIRPISFRPGAIEYEPAPGAPANLAQRLIGRLKEWTGERWLIAAHGGGGAESLWEKQKREQREARAEIERHPFVQSVMEAFPGAEIIGVRNLAQAETPEAVPAPEEADDEE
jgi:DNA polymerase-3 subunit gamma/tau